MHLATLICGPPIPLLYLQPSILTFLSIWRDLLSVTNRAESKQGKSIKFISSNTAYRHGPNIMWTIVEDLQETHSSWELSKVLQTYVYSLCCPIVLPTNIRVAEHVCRFSPKTQGTTWLFGHSGFWTSRLNFKWGKIFIFPMAFFSLYAVKFLSFIHSKQISRQKFWLATSTTPVHQTEKSHIDKAIKI